MLDRTIFLYTFVLVLVKFVEMNDLTEITLGIGFDDNNTMTCDHTLDIQKIHKYTALEGRKIKLTLKYDKNIYDCSCVGINNNDQLLNVTKYNNVTTVVVTKDMGTIWNCTVLTHINPPDILHPRVHVGKVKYVAAYCYVRVHVRSKISDQLILVNNMVMTPERTDLSVRDIDYTVQYDFANNDMVDVTCLDVNETGALSMKYEHTGSPENKFNGSIISSKLAVGFRARLHFGLNNTYTICHLKKTNDEFYVKITFIMRSKFDNIISLSINGMNLRPRPGKYNYYNVGYKFTSNKRLHVVCQKQHNLTWAVLDTVTSNLDNYKKNVTENVIDSSFSLRSAATWGCAVDEILPFRRCAERIEIDFNSLYELTDQCPMYLDLQPNNTVLELYESTKRRVIYYEFDEDDTVTLNCYTITDCKPGPLVRLTFNLNNEGNRETNISKTLVLTHKSENKIETCYMIEIVDQSGSKSEKPMKQIHVIFRQRQNTSTGAPPTEPSLMINNINSVSPATPAGAFKDDSQLDSRIFYAIGGVALIIVVCVTTAMWKLRKRNQSQGGPYERSYGNLESPSEASIPAYPTQWESNYGVPIDQRIDNDTYSVPFKPEPALYATPVPKNLRQNKKKNYSTYASLDIPSTSRQQNVTHYDDANYAEFSQKKPENCYAKVLPKSKRSGKNNSPYVNVDNEQPYANTRNEPDPMYSEVTAALKSRNNQYSNVNVARYANTPVQEYVEPTYCDASKRQ